MAPKLTANPQLSAHLTQASPFETAILAWEYFLDDQGRSPHTIKAFSADVRLLASFLPPDRSIGNLNTAEINTFLDWLQKGRKVPCSPKSLARRITSIKAFYRWLHANGVIAADPAERVVQRSVISPLPEVLTPEEIELVVETAEKWRASIRPDARPLALLLLLLHTGIKKGECLGITTNHLDLEAQDGAKVFIRYTSPASRYKERKISLPQAWVEVYKEYQGQYNISEQVFPWSQRRLEYLLEDISKAAGLSKHLSFDMCRWTCALNDWQGGMEKEQIRQKLGISKIQWREVKMKLGRLAGAPIEED